MSDLSYPDLSGYSLPQLATLYDAFAAAQRGFESIVNQPRGDAVEPVLESQIRHCSQQMKRIAETAELRCPADETGRREKGIILMKWTLISGAWSNIRGIAQHFVELTE